MASSYEMSGFKDLFETASKSPDTQVNKVGFKLENIDVISTQSKDSVTRLKFPSDIGVGLKKNKPLNLFILKDASYKGAPLKLQFRSKGDAPQMTIWETREVLSDNK